MIVGEKMREQNRQQFDKNQYVITVIEDDNIRNVNLTSFHKSKISFGRGEENDIVLTSPLVSVNHGYFELSDNSISVTDNQSTNGIFVNNNKMSQATLKDGDSVKIDDPIEPLMRGVIFILSTSGKVDDWQQIDLHKKSVITIGRDSDSDILINHISVSLKHAIITEKNHHFIIKDNNSTNGILINGELLKGDAILKERDVILIANAKLIFYKDHLLYQMRDYGVSLDAVDITKTVKVKGRKKDISQHVNLSIKPGQFVAFVGGSGAGKSTFMNCISGVSRPTSGKVYVNGNDLYANYAVLKNIIGYVPQQDIVFTDLTLKDMLKYAADLRMPDDATDSEKKNRIKTVLDIVELTGKEDVMIRNLSGGQRKRASIAVELIADPKLFFLDEPTSGLDPGTERSIMQTLRKMADSGKTIILVTHTTLNLHLCDKIAFFGSEGRLCFSGPPKDALEFFHVTDFVDIYTFLNKDTDTWYQNFNHSSYKDQVTSEETQNVTQAKNKKSFVRQFSTLSKRYAKTILNNKQQLLLLLLQAPIIAYLLTCVVSDEVFRSYDEAKMFLFAMSCASIWLGFLNSIQEICKERVILKKEYMANLKLSAYLGSKMVVQCMLGLLQAILLVVSVSLFLEVPENGIIMSWKLETILVCFLTIVSASALGLTVSTVSKNASVAMSFAPLLLVPQLLFSGIMFPLEGAVNKASYVILCRWSVEALGTTNNLNSLTDVIQEIIPTYVREEESFYTFTAEHFTIDISIIILMMIVLVIACFFILRHQLERSR